MEAIAICRTINERANSSTMKPKNVVPIADQIR